MKRALLAKGLLFAFGFIAFSALVGTLTQADATTTTSNTINFQQTTGALGDFTSFLTGPAAAVIAVLAIIGGAVMVIQGQEMSGAVKNIGVVVIAIGLLAGAGSWYKGATASVVGANELGSLTAVGAPNVSARAHLRV